MMTKINLEFSKSETRLAGFPYGETIYNDQVKGNISFDDKIEIVFPDQIEKVASSFVQGFFSAMVSVIGYSGIKQQVKIVTGTPKLTDFIWKNLY